MAFKDKQERIRVFLQLIDTFKAQSWVENIYRIIKDYDMPDHLDREFVLDALIEYYVKREEYEKCAELLKWKEDPSRVDLVLNEASSSVKHYADDMDYKEGFTVPDSIRDRFKKKRKK